METKEEEKLSLFGDKFTEKCLDDIKGLNAIEKLIVLNDFSKFSESVSDELSKQQTCEITTPVHGGVIITRATFTEGNLSIQIESKGMGMNPILNKLIDDMVDTLCQYYC